MKSPIPILVLQHPQEPKAQLGTAKLLVSHFENATLKTGLSWPSLKKILDNDRLVHSDWGVLYLGTSKQFKQPFIRGEAQLFEMDKKGNVTDVGSVKTESDERSALNPLVNTKGIKGLVVLDGSWSQSKTLWWRNAWLLKLRRFVLVPPGPSLYGPARKEPRRECVSTLEAVAYTLWILSGDSRVSDQLLTKFRAFLDESRPQKPTQETT